MEDFVEMNALETRQQAARQMERVRRVTTVRNPHFFLIFDAQPVNGTLRFRLETDSHVQIIETSGNIPVQQLQKWSDEELYDLLVRLSGGRF